MVRIAAVVALLVWAAAWAIGDEVEEAGACTGPGIPFSAIEAPIIFEGWVTDLETIPAVGLDPNYQVQFEVLRGYRGVAVGDLIEVETYLRLPGGIPVPCGSLAPEELAGKYVILGLPERDSGDFYPFLTFYLQDAPNLLPENGIPYGEAVRMAEIVTDTDPSGPLLTIEPVGAVCGEPVRYRGERFPSGEYLLGFSFGRFLDVLTIGSDGTFDTTRNLVWDGCRSIETRSVVTSVDVRSTTGVGLEWLIEIVPLTVTVPGGGDGSYPQLVVPPDSARCGSDFTVSGTGFEPGEAVSLMVSANDTKFPAQADQDGFFTARIPMPDVLCGLALGEVRAFQPGFETYGRRLATTYFTPLPPVGPPDLGNAPPGGTPAGWWLQMAGLVALVLGVSALVARR